MILVVFVIFVLFAMDSLQQKQPTIRSTQYRQQQQPGGGSGNGDVSLIFAVFLSFLAIAAMVYWRDGALLKTITDPGFHVKIPFITQFELIQVTLQTDEVYWRDGALLKTITDPGFHVKIPFITQFELIQVTLQTDEVKDIPCGTKGGVRISFGKIEVVNRLRTDYVYDTLLNYGVHYDKTWTYDKIHHEINQFCSAQSLQQVYIDLFDQNDEKMKDAVQVDCTGYAPGIEIISVCITKPSIPQTIKHNFEQMEEERTKALIAVETQKVAEKEAETQKKIALADAEKNAQVSKTQMEQKLMEKDSARRTQKVENQMYMAREKSLADADFYKVLKEAEANKLKLTPEFLDLMFIQSIVNN